jgi:arsenate reductase (thioredoxin)
LHYNLGMGSVRTVVFVCQHGAAKSVLAAALLERLAADHGLPLRALARGTEPEPQVALAVAAGLLEQSIDVRAWRPRLVTREDLAEA